MKDANYISWDDYFMGVAMLSALRSKDPSTKVGACIVNTSRRIIGIGYNGFPHGINDDEFPWERDGEYLDTKYPYVVHAEANAILNATTSLVGATVYVTLFPCNECAKLLIQSGIREVVYLLNKHADSDACKASVKMLEATGIQLRQMKAPVISFDKTK